MKVYFATDHAGFELKEILLDYVRSLSIALESGVQYDVEDVGAYKLDPQDDYPDFMHKVAEAVGKDNSSRAIILGGSGQGEAIVANRHSGVRAVVYNAPNLEIIKLSREHNDANVLSLGARFLTVEEAKKAVKLWLMTSFSNDERHIRRIEKIDLKYE